MPASKLPICCSDRCVDDARCRVGAYEHWLDDESVSLPQALGDAFDVVAHRTGRAEIDERREPLVRHLRMQGQVCVSLGSPMYGDMLDRVAADVEAGGVFAAILSGHEDDPDRLALPLRLLGGLHRLALDGHAPALRRWYPSTGGHWDAKRRGPTSPLTAADYTDRCVPPSISRRRPTRSAGPPR